MNHISCEIKLSIVRVTVRCSGRVLGFAERSSVRPEILDREAGIKPFEKIEGC
jgi:hypothetical protein